jgi:alpha-1,3/alpha-1,6-mannosyltransferase
MEMEGKREHIVFFHPDLGIGGAERLVIDAAVGLQSRGHKVTIFTSYCDPNHCFDEARDGKRPLLLWHLRTHAHVRTSS